ncbi:MAG: hypothetical protein ACXWQ5_00590 [Ktedonobacterales bacterium]
MAEKIYDVEFHPGRTEPATRQRLHRFMRYISRVIGGVVLDNFLHRQGARYVVCYVRIRIPEAERANVEAHPYVASMKAPPRPDLGTLDMPVDV